MNSVFGRAWPARTLLFFGLVLTLVRIKPAIAQSTVDPGILSPYTNFHFKQEKLFGSDYQPTSISAQQRESSDTCPNLCNAPRNGRCSEDLEQVCTCHEPYTGGAVDCSAREKRSCSAPIGYACPCRQYCRPVTRSLDIHHFSQKLVPRGALGLGLPMQMVMHTLIS